MDNKRSILDRWEADRSSLETLHSNRTEDLLAESRQTRDSSVTTANVHDVTFGTGYSIYSNTIIPAIEAVQAELILVTCFWARSRTLDALSGALRKLSAKALSNRSSIRVRICFSSSSLYQKLFHTTSLQGRLYAPSEWQSKLSLPNASELHGLDLEVKSIFVLPFSVMHPKFVILDRKHVYLPSCNISWEDWFEGSVHLSGPVMEHFINLWQGFWASEADRVFSLPSGENDADSRTISTSQAGTLSSLRLDLNEIPCIFLPSSHHRNPHFSFPWQVCSPPPSTPLNTFLLSALENASKEIYVQTPNLTSPPVLSALLSAMKRGVHVSIVTSERLMMLEQLLTAGTTTKRCVRTLTKRYERLLKQRYHAMSDDLESGSVNQVAILNIKFYQPDSSPAPGIVEPVQSHLKLTIIDEELTVLGSGNMDRASWYTSQELGVAFISRDLASLVRTQVDLLMSKRCREVYRSMPD